MVQPIGWERDAGGVKMGDFESEKYSYRMG